MIDRLNAENSVIGSILIDPRCLQEILPILEPEHFSLAVNQTLYRAALALDRRGEAIDPVLIAKECARMGNPVRNEYILQLMDLTPTAANAKEYAEETRDAAQRRELKQLSSDINTRVDDHHDTREIIVDTSRKLEQLMQDGVAGGVLTPEKAVLRFMEHRDEVEDGRAQAVVSTGYRILDIKMGGGMLKGGVYVLAGRPGMGKSTLALNIAERVAQNTGSVLFVSLEMDDEQLTAKRLAARTGIPGNRLLMDKLTEEEYRRLAEETDKLLQIPMYISNEVSPTVEQIYGEAKAVQGLKLLVIDYFGKINPGDRAKRGTRTEYTTEISGAVKDMARALKIPVLLLAQLNRESEKRSDHRPQLSDLRDTGAVEQDADGVILLYRDKYYDDPSNRDPYQPEDINVEVAKNRHGGTGRCILKFYAATSKMTPDTNSREEYLAMINAGLG